MTTRLGYLSGGAGAVDLLGEGTWVTTDGGHSWRRAAIPGGARDSNGPVALSAGTVSVPVWRCHRRAVLAIYSRSDTTWRAGPQLTRASHSRHCDISASVTATGTAWAALTTNSVSVARISRGDRHWHTEPLPPLATHYPATIQAADSRRAWLLAPANQHTMLYATTDGGASWAAIHPPGT